MISHIKQKKTGNAGLFFIINSKGFTILLVLVFQLVFLFLQLHSKMLLHL